MKLSQKQIRRHGSILSTLLMGLSLICCLSGCSNPSVSTSTTPTASAASCSPEQRSITLNLGSEPPSLNPTRMTDLNSFQVFSQVMSGLVALDHHGRPIPALAQSWQVSPDSRTYTFTLRENARWSDGQPVTAQQVVDSWRYSLAKERGNPYAFLLYAVRNVQRYAEGQLTDPSLLGIHAEGTHRLVVELNYPVAYFPALMSFPVAMPLRLDVIQWHPDRWTEAGYLLGTGPFVLSEWVHDSHLVLKPNPYYWQPVQGLSSVKVVMIPDANTALSAYRQGTLDVVDTLPQWELASLKQRPDAHSQTMDAIFYLGINVKKPPMTDVRVRQAFALAIDRRELMTFLQNPNQPISGIFPPGQLGYNPDIGLGFDPPRARRLLAEAGYPNGQGLPQVTLAFPTRFELRREAEVLQAFWKKHLGVTVRLASLEWKQYLQQVTQDPPALFRESWYADYPDPDTFASLFASYQGINRTRWRHPVYDEGTRQAARMSNRQARLVLYDTLQKLLLEQETVVIPLYANSKVWLASPRLTGFGINSMNHWELQDVQLQSCTPQASHP